MHQLYIYIYRKCHIIVASVAFELLTILKMANRVE